MRCPDCNKFVPFDEGNVDEVEAEIDEDSGSVRVTGRVVLPCAECGTELKELNVDEEFDTCDEFERDVVAAIKAEIPEEYRDKVTQEWVESEGGGDPLEARCRVRYEFDGDPDSSFHERTQTEAVIKKGKDKGKKKPIKNSRYAKTYKGVTVSGTVKRTIRVSIPGRPGTEIVDDAAFEHTVEEQSSAFDELT